MPDYDLAIIGAGIHGVAVARAAAQRGHRVVVLEQYPAAAMGTSSRSSKLIHGGLRYLESGQLRLVRECLRERARLLRRYPDLVRLTPFHIPIYQTTRRGPLTIAAGLSLYALLGGKGFARVPKSEWPALDGLHRDGLRAVFRYWDAQTDDRLLTERIAQEARGQGAAFHFNTRLTHGSWRQGQWRLACSRQAGTLACTARCLVNASGPWANLTLAKLDPPADGLAMQGVQGTHIVVPGTPARGVYYLEAPADGRAVFIMPWQQQTLIGTTETPYRGDPGAAVALESEITYLLATRNHYFSPPLTREAVTQVMCGLRLLPAGDSTPFNRRRDTLLHRDGKLPALLTIYGGKLTSHQVTAERVLKQLDL